MAEATDQGESDEEGQVQEVEIDDIDVVPTSPQSFDGLVVSLSDQVIEGEVACPSVLIALGGMLLPREGTRDDGSSSSKDEGGNRAPVGEVRQGKGGRQDTGAKRKKGPIEMNDEVREAVRGFKKGSTQVPASAEDVASGAFKQACLSEWANNIVGNDVLGKEVTRQQVKAVVKMGWRLTWKEQEGKPRKPKAWFFGKGFTDHRKVDTYIGTPPLWVICTIIFFCVSQGYEIDAADVTAAFFTSRDHNVERIGALIVESIPDLPAKCPFPDVTQKEWEERRRKAAQFKPGKIYLVEMGLYGLPCAAALFDAKLLSMMTELGFQRLETGLAVKKDDRGNTTAIVAS
uniref:Reverse transcriptase Ty1/copia-type domain-containing protein n=1 Tax=Chromera velia CCMP2878 TaxID=1169474 RepID=A0A0G4G002_9ALVE|eukprot:Cvel_3962.t1-p1 / transcript=Cvel_3962.t1 / gene=Cvel_3962 / organism=Chromera_velia_CCMP2878 / gene_product=hypothetical protein / transcript_product=hypothetical protein / location=Cvel_scaffold168:49074-50348(+) / protein_length=344 / sequence_SO=supercontig / SO=protein_coding / is_pseudo=false